MRIMFCAVPEDYFKTFFSHEAGHLLDGIKQNNEHMEGGLVETIRNRIRVSILKFLVRILFKREGEIEKINLNI